MITKKQIVATYKGKRYDESDQFSTVTSIAYHDHYAVLLSGGYDPYGGGFDIEAVIDRNTGNNVIEGHHRPADTKDDAIDVAMEIMSSL